MHGLEVAGCCDIVPQPRMHVTSSLLPESFVLGHWPSTVRRTSTGKTGELAFWHMQEYCALIRQSQQLRLAAVQKGDEALQQHCQKCVQQWRSIMNEAIDAHTACILQVRPCLIVLAFPAGLVLWSCTVYSGLVLWFCTGVLCTLVL